ncbi:transposase [Ferrovum myxofaciens]|uniref:transposase n=1 Tax=Ferrovum myxofaciens TaxID=416213 RepID=UPI003EC12F00
MKETFDMFRMRLELMDRPDHSLEVLGTKIRWREIEANLSRLFQRKPTQVRKLEPEGMFGTHTFTVDREVSRASRKRLPFRLMASLLYLKQAYNESDEGVVERWSESPIWQSFSWGIYFGYPESAIKSVNCCK